MTDSAFAEIVHQAEARVGMVVKGKWRIDRVLGVGGMAAVYEATHRNNKRVAIKMLHPTLSTLRRVRERFQREGYVANSVGHSGAVSVDDDDVTEDGCAFLVMELLEGETLEARRVRCGGNLPVEDVLVAAEQVLSTLAAAHAKGIVHRDLKPDNLFLTHAGETKVLDFGIARLRDFAMSVGRTQTGAMLGTPAFMPPEQARARWDEVDGQSDIWSLGATMFTLLSGQEVHQAATFNELVIVAATTHASSISALMPTLPETVSELVDRALAFKKADRFADAASMRRQVRRTLVLLDEMGALDSTHAAHHRPPATGERTSHPGVGALSPVVAALGELPWTSLDGPTREEPPGFATLLDVPGSGDFCLDELEALRSAGLGTQPLPSDDDPAGVGVERVAGEPARARAGVERAAGEADGRGERAVAWGFVTLLAVWVIVTTVLTAQPARSPVAGAPVTRQPTAPAAVLRHEASQQQPGSRTKAELSLPRAVAIQELPLAPPPVRASLRKRTSAVPASSSDAIATGPSTLIPIVLGEAQAATDADAEPEVDYGLSPSRPPH